MALDRSKFKATNIAKAREQDQEIKESLGKNRAFTGYIKLDDIGPDPDKKIPNVIRIYPPHPEEDGGGEVFAEPKVTVFLPMLVPEKDANGNEILDKHNRPVLKEGKKSVFNGRIHGNLDRDLVEEYVRVALERLEEEKKFASGKDLEKVNNKITHIQGNFKLKIQGLNYQSKWVMYVDKIVGETRTFGTLEIGTAIKERLNQLAATADAADKAISTDPFTDVEEGRAIYIYYNKNATKSTDYYQTELDPVLVPEKINGKTYNLPRMFPFTDDQLEAFMKVEPLAKRFKNVFSQRDFDLQLEGLQYFDQKNNIDLFQDEEFIRICDEIQQQVPEDPTEEAAEGEDEGDALGATKAQEFDEPEQDMFDLMDRKELADWHRTNKSGVIVKPTITTDELKEMAREHLASLEETNEEGEESEEEQYEGEDDSAVSDEEGQDEEEETSKTTKTTTLSRIQQMKLRSGAGK